MRWDSVHNDSFYTADRYCGRAIACANPRSQRSGHGISSRTPLRMRSVLIPCPKPPSVPSRAFPVKLQSQLLHMETVSNTACRRKADTGDLFHIRSHIHSDFPYLKPSAPGETEQYGGDTPYICTFTMAMMLPERPVFPCL